MPEGKYPAASGTLQEQTVSLAVRQPRPVENTPGYVVGVDVGGTNLRLALADMSGNIAAKWSTSTVGMREPEKVIRLILDGVKNILSSARRPRMRFGRLPLVYPALQMSKTESWWPPRI